MRLRKVYNNFFLHQGYTRDLLTKVSVHTFHINRNSNTEGHINTIYVNCTDFTLKLFQPRASHSFILFKRVYTACKNKQYFVNHIKYIHYNFQNLFLVYFDIYKIILRIYQGLHSLRKIRSC